MSNVKQFEKKITSLETQVKNLTTENADLKSQLESLKSSSTMSPEDLEALLNNASLAQDNEALKIELKVSQDQVKDLEKALQEASKKGTPAEPKPAVVAKPEISKSTFEHAGKKYGFAMAAVILDGEKITAKDVLGSKDLQKQLVEMGSGFIKEAQ